MSRARFDRESKRQLGQFLTPPPIAKKIVEAIDLDKGHKILEPSFGDGSFLFPIIEKLLTKYEGDRDDRLDQIFASNIYGVELDQGLYNTFFDKLKDRYEYIPPVHHLYNGDFFLWSQNHTPGIIAPREYFSQFAPFFDYIIGNPPFGGSIEARIQDGLDNIYGFRLGEKIKKETYSFFLVKSFDLTKNGGEIVFICSDSFLTINTMKGLRKLLLEHGEVLLEELDFFSDETSHPMVVLHYTKTGSPGDGIRSGRSFLARDDIAKTKNLSWKINAEYSRYFSGVTVGDYLVATSGMTTGNNDLFLRKIQDGHIIEPYRFEFFEEPITLERELRRARLGVLSERKRAEICELEGKGSTRRNIRTVHLETPTRIILPDQDYCYYNKAVNAIVYSAPRWVIYWKDDGDAVYTFKKNGNWYLHGVGGQKFFKSSGITWSLIAPRLYTRYLPTGYILDSGAPCAFLRQGVDAGELFFVMGWMLTSTCSKILKEVINHTRNIQGKDVERLPYPVWVSDENKQIAVDLVKGMIKAAMDGKSFSWTSKKIAQIESVYQL
jgi:hypothetical protein